MRHPRDMGTAEVEDFLNIITNERQVSPSTHNQALSAILFLYREVLGVELLWLKGLNRPVQKKRISSVLTRDEVAALFSFLNGDMALLAKLLYCTGMRLMEGLRLRIKDVDFDRRVIVGCFRHPRCRSIRTRAWSGGTASPLDALLTG